MKCVTVIYQWTLDLRRTATNDYFCGWPLVTEAYNKLMPPETGPFRVIEVPPTTISIDAVGTGNTVSIYKATLAPSAKFIEQQNLFTPKEPVYTPKNKVY